MRPGILQIQENSACVSQTPLTRLVQIADAKKVEAIPGVKGTIRQGGQFQVIIGNDVPAVYDEVCALIGQTPVAQIEDDEKKIISPCHNFDVDGIRFHSSVCFRWI